MKNWSKPQLTDLTLSMTEYTLYAPDYDGLWNEVTDSDCDPPPNVIGSGRCQGCN